MSALRGSGRAASKEEVRVWIHFGPERKAALRFIFTKSLFARLQTQPFFPRLKSCGSASHGSNTRPVSPRCRGLKQPAAACRWCVIDCRGFAADKTRAIRAKPAVADQSINPVE